MYRVEITRNYGLVGMISLDAIDRRILGQLQKDGRISNADLAERVGLSSSPCWRRVKALEEAGVIKGYAAQLDARAVGLSVNVFMSVSLSTQVEKSLQAFERAAASRPEVMECYLMTCDSDYLLRVVVPDLDAYERFVMDFTKIPGIAQIRSSFALRPVKQGAALPLQY
jgi:Lrp/AsnC family transcriptional regulator, leucine-responsive regulatory protein